MAVPVSREATESTGHVAPGAVAAVALVCCAVFLVYLPVFEFSFVNYDDPEYVLSNSHVNTGLKIDNVRWALTACHSANWHPLTWVSHMVDVSLFGSNPSGHHGVNLLLHLLAGIALYLFLRALGVGSFAAVALMALFMIHPTKVESVAWISERKDLLCALFSLLALWKFVQFLDRRRRLDYLLSLVAFLLAALSKPMAVVVPPLMLISAWLFVHWHPKCRFQGLLPGFRASLPFWLGAAVLSVVTVVAQSTVDAVASVHSLPVIERVVRMPYHYLRYLAMFFWPWPMRVFYGYESEVAVPILVLSAVLMVGLTGIAYAFRHRTPSVWAGWVWFVLALIPVIGLVQVGWQSVADRYLYLASLGLLAMAAGALNSTGIRFIAAGCAVVAAVAWGAITWVHLPVWSNSESLYLHVLERDSLVVPALGNLAIYYDKNGNASRAEPLARAAFSMGTQPVHTGIVYGAVLLHLDKPDSAIAIFEKVLTHEPGNAHAWYNRALAQLKMADTAGALGSLDKALSCEPGLSTGLLTVGDIANAQGRYGDAERYFSRALEVNPGTIHARLGRGLARAALGNCDGARADIAGLPMADSLREVVMLRLGECSRR